MGHHKQKNINHQSATMRFHAAPNSKNIKIHMQAPIRSQQEPRNDTCTGTQQRGRGADSAQAQGPSERGLPRNGPSLEVRAAGQRDHDGRVPTLRGCVQWGRSVWRGTGRTGGTLMNRTLVVESIS